MKRALLFEVNSADVVGFQEVDIMQLSFEYDFKETCDTKIIVMISENEAKIDFWYEVSLIHCAVEGLNEWQVGKYDYEVKPHTAQNNRIVKAIVLAKNQGIFLTDIHLRLLRYK